MAIPNRALLAALGICVALVLTGCGDEMHTGGDAETTEPATVDAMIKALETMFSRQPGEDSWSADAYNRAAPYLTPELAAQGNSRTERGPGRQWQEWAAARAMVDAEACIVVAAHVPDAPDRIERIVIVTQTVTAPDDHVLESSELETSVTATLTPDGWKVSGIAVR